MSQHQQHPLALNLSSARGPSHSSSSYPQLLPSAASIANQHTLSHQPVIQASDKQISRELWEARMAEVEPPRDIINKLVMNFLIVEGYKEGALKFQKEAGIKAEMDEELIDSRIRVRQLIEKGLIDEAVREIDAINPEIMIKDRDLTFALRRQELVELIKQRNFDGAISFAQNKLSGAFLSTSTSRRQEQDLDLKYQAEVDKTMSLLMYDDPSKAPMADLISQQARRRLASQVNQAILKAQRYPSDIKLEFYWKLLQYAQDQLTQSGMTDFPKMTDPFQYTAEESGGDTKMVTDDDPNVSHNRSTRIKFNI